MTIKLYAMAARGLALSTSMVTALLVLLAPTSLANLSTSDGVLMDTLNGVVLAMCLLGFADLIWHDIRGRLIWPTLNTHFRHHVCVLLYSVLAGAYGLRLFSWADQNTDTNLILGLYYAMQAGFIGLVAVAIALEPRNGAPD